MRASSPLDFEGVDYEFSPDLWLGLLPYSVGCVVGSGACHFARTGFGQGGRKVADQGITWLKRHGREEKPFFLYLGLQVPHPAFITSWTYTKLIDETGIGIPPADEYDHPVMRYQRIVKNWEHGFSEAMVKKTRLTYFAMIAETDAIVGHLLGALEQMGLRDSTYVIYISDHGENAMEHRQFYKMNLYESSARVPLIIAGPGAQKGLQVAALTSLVDVYPTLMDMARSNPTGALDGHSLMPELRGQPGGRPDWVLSQFHDTTRHQDHGK